MALQELAKFGKHDDSAISVVVTVFIYQQGGRGRDHSGVGKLYVVASS